MSLDRTTATARNRRLGSGSIALLGLILGVGVLTGAAVQQSGATTPSAPTRTASRALALVTGDDSKAPAGIFLVRTQPEFVKLWERHRGVKETGKRPSIYNPLGMPTIDFDRCMVLVVFEGDSWNSAGYHTHSVEENTERVLIRYEANSFQTMGPDGGGQRVCPYAFFVLQKSSKPLVAEMNTQSLIGHPPVWTRQAKFPGSTEALSDPLKQ
ncbi:MAG: hypothetical protein AAF488_14570 [Planctomycetota bacterium]